MDFFYAEPGSLWVRLCENKKPEDTINNGFDLWLVCSNNNKGEGEAVLRFPKPIMYNTPIMKLGEERIIKWNWARGNGGFKQHYYRVMAVDYEGESRIGWMRDCDLKELVPCEC